MKTTGRYTDAIRAFQDVEAIKGMSNPENAGFVLKAVGMDSHFSLWCIGVNRLGDWAVGHDLSVREDGTLCWSWGHYFMSDDKGAYAYFEENAKSVLLRA